MGTVTVALLMASASTGEALAQNGTPPDGHQLFMQNGCFACHGEFGYGGVGPRFREDRFLAIADYVVAQILIGRGPMPSYAQLSDQQIAALASYIRSSWGNNFGGVKPEQVAQVRKEIQLSSSNLAGSSLPRQGPPPGQPAHLSGPASPQEH